MSEQFEYRAGNCNIDSTGVRYRKILAYIAALGAIIALIAIYSFHIQPIIRYGIMAAFGYAISLNILQVKERFCVANATKGTIEVGRKMLPIVSELHRKLDREKRNRMLGKAIAIAIVSGLSGLLPL